MSNQGIIVSKEGIDVKSADCKDLLISSQFDTFKVLKTGTLTRSSPSETVSGGDMKRRTSSYEHDLDYIPFALPITYGANATGESGTYIVNTLNDAIVPPVSFGPSMEGEFADVYLTSTHIVLAVRRLGGFMGVSFPSTTATLYYTIFYNRMDEEVE